MDAIRNILLSFALLLVSAGTVYAARMNLLSLQQATTPSERAPLYLPDSKYVRLVTLGFNTTASKILWFSTINYFGRQFALKSDYRWLGNMCDLVTNLDERPKHSFEFCATLLSWMAKQPEKSSELLTKAIQAHPDYWRFWYLRGFTNWYFLNRLDLAKDDFLYAARLPDAPPFLASVASRLLASEQGPSLAREFLEEMLKESTDPIVRKTLQKRLAAAILSESLQSIRIAVSSFRQSNARVPEGVDELLKLGYLNQLPLEPYGGTFIIDTMTGEVSTTSKKKGIAFKGRNADTGLMQQENVGSVKQ